MTILERILLVYNDKGSKQAIKDVKKLEKNFANAGKKIAKAFAVTTAAAGALAIKIGKDAVQAAMEDQKSQVLLANALRNTVGASDEAIAASENFITSLQNQLGVADDELRPALATLATASGDLQQAQTLLGLSLDVAAGSGKSLSTITAALSKAQNGNFTALSRLFPALDRSAIKSGDLVAVSKQLADLYGGAAQENANTFAGKLNILKLRFGEVLENLGNRFLPILEKLVTLINEKVIPAIDAWLEANGEKLARVFENAIGYIVAFTKSLFDAFNFVAQNIKVFKVLGAVLIATFAGAKVAAAVTVFVGAIKSIIAVMKLLRAGSIKAAAATALATGGASAVAGAAAFAVALIGVNKAAEKFGDTAEDASDKVDFKFNSLTLGANDYTKGLGKLTVAQGKNTAASNKAAKAAALEEKAKKVLAKLDKKFQVVATSEKDPIALQAALLNLKKQDNLEEQRKIEALQKNLDAQKLVNENAQRYADLLTVLSDQVISSEEVAVLANKWGVTTGQVLEYIAHIYAANTTDVSDAAVVNLLMKWGLTKEQAEKYVDFTRALKDEKIDDKEIEELMAKWGMSRQGVLDYAKEVRDGSALQSVLGKSWASPGDATAESWRKALEALNNYLAALKGANFNVAGAPSVAATKIVPQGSVINPFNPASDPVTKEKIQENIDTLTSLRETTDKGTAISFLLKEHIDTLTDSLTPFVQSTLGDEQSRLRNMGFFDGPGISSSFDPAAFRRGEEASMTTININVEGNIQSEADFAEAIRSRLLLEQQSGKPLLFVGGL